MTPVPELADKIAQLPPEERERLIEALESSGSAPGLAERLRTPAVVATPGVCGGAARIIRTRIPIWTLERMRQRGISEADILRSFPVLRAVDLVQAWAYVAAHPEEIEQQIRDNEE